MSIPHKGIEGSNPSVSATPKPLKTLGIDRIDPALSVTPSCHAPAGGSRLESGLRCICIGAARIGGFVRPFPQT
ncbi:hypothetical protein BOSEA31B_10557 [Hyphomicrobiales bacterium]|nr:hypothetical protein BOSEA31B_10557 [Hyphomicrobiales bacterium]CAH1700411.1 hypothetical protein BOSEA1005_20110 [Hyphomicrobiales bacterium]CAI0344291.1 hypothetical protein BO1005MUT1_320121 [Hyphomicrobiales bacterium]